MFQMHNYQVIMIIISESETKCIITDVSLIKFTNKQELIIV